MSVKHLEDHRAPGTECLESSEGLCGEEALDGVLLTVVIRAEVEPPVGRVEIGAATEVIVCGEDERALVREMVEIAGGVRAVGDSDRGMTNQELLGLAPAGDGALRGAEGHRNRSGARGAVLDGLQEAAGAFGRMRRTERGGRCGESERVP